MPRIRLEYLHRPTSGRLTFTVPVETPDHWQFDAQVMRAAGAWLAPLEPTLNLDDLTALSVVSLDYQSPDLYYPGLSAVSQCCGQGPYQD